MLPINHTPQTAQKQNSTVHLLIIISLLFALVFTIGCSKKSSSKRGAKVQGVELIAANTQIATDSRLQLNVTAFYDDGNRADFASRVIWTSSDTSIATVSEDGVVTAVGNGTVTITAEYNGITETIELNVSAATLTSLSISPSNASIIPGQIVSLTATGLYSDGSKQNLDETVTWSVDNSSIASLSDNNVTGVSTGNTVITATSGGKSASTTLSVKAPSLVSINLDFPQNKYLPGQSVELKASGIFNDAKNYDITNIVQWSASDSSIVSLENKSLKFVKQGNVTLTATAGTISASFTFTVIADVFDHIEISPADTPIAAGENLQLQATGILDTGESIDITDVVEWSSDNETATVSNSVGNEGLLSTESSGTVTVTASTSNSSGSVTIVASDATLQSIEVTPQQLTIAKSTTGKFVATGIYSDNSFKDITANVSWTVADSTIASIDNSALFSGKIRGLASGSTEITAKLGTISATASVVVTNAKLIDIYIENADQELRPGDDVQLRTIGVFDDGTTQDITDQVTWISGDNSKTTISNDASNPGLATSITAGDTSITSALDDNSATATISSVNKTISSVRIEADTNQLAKGTSTTVRAIAHYSNNTSSDITQSVTLLSSSSSGMTVSNASANKGEITAITTGDYTVSILSEGNYTVYPLTVTVTEAILNRIELSPQNKTIAKDSAIQFTATGIFSDNTQQNLTEQVLWQSSDDDVAFISNASGKSGYVLAKNAGSITISATFGTTTGSSSLTVKPHTLVNLIVNASDNTAAVAAGFTKTLTVTAYYDNGSTQDVSSQVSWQSIDTGICQLENALSGNGIVKTKAKGSCQINVNFQNESASFVFEVTEATLSSLAISPDMLELPIGLNATFQITGTYSDNSQRDITSDVTLHTTSSSIYLDNTTARVQGISVGSAIISAYHSGKEASANISITPATLTSITVQSNTTNFFKGRTALIKATGTFSDASTNDISDQVLWSINDASLATINNATNYGVITLNSSGNITISASLGNVSGDLSVDIIDNPNIAVAMSISTSPNVILNDNTETSTLSVKLIPASDSGTIADDTAIEVKIFSSDNTLLDTQTIKTLDDTATYDFKIETKGSYIVTAKIPDTLIAGITTIYATDDLSEMIARSRSFPATLTQDNKIAAGSVLGFSIINLSNRTFTIDGFIVLNNGNNELYNSTNPETPLNLADMTLSAGETVSILHQLSADADNTIQAAIYLTDQQSGENYILPQSYILATP